jgi:hypothetical protein
VFGADARLFGTWQATVATIDGRPVTVASALQMSAGATTRSMSLLGEASRGATFNDINSSGMVASTTGTFSAVSGSGKLVIGTQPEDFSYQMISPNILKLTFTTGGKTVVVIWVKSVPPTDTTRDSSLEGAWKATGVNVNGEGITPASFYGLAQSSNVKVLQLLGDGTGFSREVAACLESPLARRQALTWAGSGGAWMEQQGALLLHGSYATGNNLLLLTYLDPATGNTVSVLYSRWPQLPAGATTPAQIQGIWRVTDVTLNGGEQSQRFFFHWQPGSTEQDFDFYPDGTGEEREMSPAGVALAGLGTWYVKGATMHLMEIDWSADVPYTLVGGTLSMGVEVPGTGYVAFSLQRSG